MSRGRNIGVVQQLAIVTAEEGYQAIVRRGALKNRDSSHSVMMMIAR